MSAQNEKDLYVTTVLEQLVKLVINQDHVVQGWQKFLITLETALIVALAYLVFAFTNGRAPSWFLNLCFVIIPATGIAAAIVLTLVMIRERKWQVWYVEQIRALQDNRLPRIFPAIEEGWSPPQCLAQIPIGYISKVMIGFVIAIVLFWIVIGSAGFLLGTKAFASLARWLV